MREQANYSGSVFTPFGGEFVHERHLDEIATSHMRPGAEQVVALLTVSLLEELLSSLRTALSLR
jgi:hypothetical protein